MDHGTKSPRQPGAAQPARARRSAGGAWPARQPGRSGAQRQRAADGQLFCRLRRQVRRSGRERPPRQRARLRDALRAGDCASPAGRRQSSWRRWRRWWRRLHPDLRVPAGHRARRQGMREAGMSAAAGLQSGHRRVHVSARHRAATARMRAVDIGFVQPPMIRCRAGLLVSRGLRLTGQCVPHPRVARRRWSSIRSPIPACVRKAPCCRVDNACRRFARRRWSPARASARTAPCWSMDCA